jgi:hypothetical protein
VNRAPSSTAKAVIIAAAVTIVLAAIVSWFAWPAKEVAPRDLPIVVAGPPPVAAALADQLRSERAGAFDVTTVADADAADEVIRAREAYGAIVVGPDGPSLHIATAASPTVAALLTQAAQEFGQGRPVPVVDVVRAGPDDPRGAGFTAGFLPLLLAAMVAGIILAVVISGRQARIVGVVTFAVLAGLVGAAMLDWLGLTAGNYLGVAGAIALVALAISATVAGLAAVLGPPGIALGVVLVFLFGNPISGAAAAPELLPEPWGVVGQLLPPGAGVSLVRSAGFFDGAGSAAPLWTLVVWAALGLVALVLGRPFGHALSTGARSRESAGTSTATPAA